MLVYNEVWKCLQRTSGRDSVGVKQRMGFLRVTAVISRSKSQPRYFDTQVPLKVPKPHIENLCYIPRNDFICDVLCYYSECLIN